MRLGRGRAGPLGDPPPARHRPERRAAPLDLSPLEQVLAELDTSTLAGLRDQALLLLGFAAALRRSELVALDVEHLAFSTARGLLVTIASSKTDQERAGATVAVPYARARNDRCAVRVLRTWLEAAGIHRGPVFRRMRRGDTVRTERLTGQSVALIIKRRAKAAGLGPEQLSGHSLRAGYVTAAASAGVEERKIANVSRHKTSPSCAATSAPRQHSTTSAKCCSPRAPFGAHQQRKRRFSLPISRPARGLLLPLRLA